MRIWSLHPRLLDRAGLVAGWREALLAQKVLAGETTGYRSHPQLQRFRAHPEPLAAIGAYLRGLQEEATARGYRFDAARIREPEPAAGVEPLPVTAGQLLFELEHLRGKCASRAPEAADALPAPGVVPPAHPLMRVEPGDVEDWERG